MILILIGKTGAGKDTILRQIRIEYSFKRVVSDTTRPMRSGEIDKYDYTFVDLEEFRRREYLEIRAYKTTVNGKAVTYYYGCPNNPKFYERDRDFVAIFDPQGAKEIIEKVGGDNCFCVYLDAPTLTRKERVIERGDFTTEEWLKRIEDDDARFSDDIINDIVNFRFTNYQVTPDEAANAIVECYRRWKEDVSGNS